MKQQKALLRITELLSRFNVQINLLNANAQFDINIISEDVLIPILDILFDVKLVNIKYDTNNAFPGIDLCDDGKKVSFQITSNSRSSKIKNTAEKIKKYKLYLRYKTFYVIVLDNEVDDFNQTAINSISEGLFKIDNSHIFSFIDLYKLISSKPLEKILKVESILEQQFSDSVVNLNESAHALLEEFSTAESKSLVTELKSCFNTRHSWLEKKSFLLETEPTTVDANAIFALRKSIEQSTNRIIEYDNRIVTLLHKLRSLKMK